jgi:glycerol-3-phosphate O-acyltransferase/dihydroxyacetone phosphate acyltransferase
MTHARKTWLDERLFGWSRSAKRGTSAWGGFSSHEASRAATPDASDSEEGDYEHVLGYLPSDGDGTPSRVRSRSLRSSYADLQQLKHHSNAASGVVAASGRANDHADPAEISGLLMRHGHRERRSSLNDGVALERIGALDREESFREATEDINQENSTRKHEDDVQ